ncbi:response regulator transcription factor, partial [Micromonospora sp. LOL_023]|uniref:response regulator transcription factor n=1 Tax=Micromonospora sp. LOL_023 TaxID=3345418 RepID=UPI003A8A84AC
DEHPPEEHTAPLSWDVRQTGSGPVRLLAAGYKDEATARELRISVRTYRRHVATLMERLNAESRFQAGIQAAKAGLLAAT